MGPVGEAELVAIALQTPALRAVADDQQVAVVAGRLEQVGRPDQVLDPLLRPEAADDADQAVGIRRQAQLGQQFRPRNRLRRLGHANAVGDDCEFFSRQASFDVELFHAAGIGDDPLRALGQGSVDGQVQRRFPRIDAPLPGDDVLHARRDRRLPAVAVRGEEPGMHDVGLEFANQRLQPPIGERIDLPALADHRDRYAG